MVFHPENLEPYHVGRFEPREKHCEYMEYPCVTLTFALMRRKYIPFFDEKYKRNYEDVDLNLKVKQDGYKIVYCPESEVYHFESASMPMIQNFWELREESRMVFHRLWNVYLPFRIAEDNEFWTKGRRYK
jgi:GT2 family glycosyltransferase